MTTDGPWTLWVSVHSVHYISYIGRRTSYNVALSPETLWVSVLKWSASDYTDQAKAMSVHDIAQPPELSESQDTLYIVHCPSYNALRTSYIVRCTSLHVVSVEWVSHRLYWLGRNNVSPWYCTTPWALRVSVHCISTSYIVHRPSYVVRRTSAERSTTRLHQPGAFFGIISASFNRSIAWTSSSQIYRTRLYLQHP